MICDVPVIFRNWRITVLKERGEYEEAKKDTGVAISDFSDSNGICYIILCGNGKSVFYGIVVYYAWAAIIDLYIYVYLSSCKG